LTTLVALHPATAPAPEKQAISPQTEQNRFAQAKDGLDAFYRELAQLLIYPPEARQNGVKGKAFIAFVVEKDGSLSHYHIARGFHPACDQAALEAVRQTRTHWIPAKVNGITVRQEVTVPVIFDGQ
ncbi:MAG: energy transducer TonB, partial [Bacteroidia bacterium]|nr:energy transducer TonB [Bacteroidia bacterium]